jgi:hypothetical protein
MPLLIDGRLILAEADHSGARSIQIKLSMCLLLIIKFFGLSNYFTPVLPASEAASYCSLLTGHN